MDKMDRGNKMNWFAHLDIIIFIIVFFPVSIEYILWRINRAILITIEDKK